MMMFLLVLCGCTVTVPTVDKKDGGGKPTLGSKDGGSSSMAADGSANTNACDERLGTDPCNTCVGQKCCAAAKACLDDMACVAACGDQGNPDDCAALEKGAPVIMCVQNDCAASCQ